MIARIWRGTVRADDATDYARYITVSLWESEQSVQGSFGTASGQAGAS